jgi:hypothetical protein
MTTGIKDLLAVCGIAIAGLAVSLGFALVPAASTDLVALFARVAG